MTEKVDNEVSRDNEATLGGFEFGQRMFSVDMRGALKAMGYPRPTDGPTVYAKRVKDNHTYVCPGCNKVSDKVLVCVPNGEGLSHVAFGVCWCECGTVSVWNNGKVKQVYDFNEDLTLAEALLGAHT